jgi:NADH-quinone oxidoreductase subunit L
MGAFAAGMFHLITHAFFKGLLFLAAGSVLLGMERGHHHLSHHEGRNPQSRAGEHKGNRAERSAEHEVEAFDPGDMRNMGGLRKTMPVTFWVYLIGALALSGVFPFAGFWSKDEILAYAQQNDFTVIYWLLAIAAFLTAFYMGRQIWMVFFGEPRHAAAAHAEESSKVITVPLMVLAALSVVGGALNYPGVDTLSNWLENTVQFIKPIEFQMNVALISTGLALLAILISWLLYGRKPLKVGEIDPLKKMLGPIFTGMERKWFVDELYWALFLDRYVDASRFVANVIDEKFWHDWFHEKVIVGTYNWLSRIALNRYADQRGIDAFFNNLGQWTKDTASSLRRFQNGFVRSYALFVLIGVVAILGYLIFK